MLRLKSFGHTATDFENLVVLEGESNRLFWLESVTLLSSPPDWFDLFINDYHISHVDRVISKKENKYFFYLFEHPLRGGDQLTFGPKRPPPPVINTRLLILYHDLPDTAELLPESSPFPYNPYTPPFPWPPFSPTPDPPWPPYPPDPPWPPYPPLPPIPPFPPADEEDFVYRDFAQVPEFKTPIPVTFSQKNRLKNTPYVSSALRPSFFPPDSFVRRANVNIDYTRNFSHVLAEGVFNTIPLRCTETGQLITTNVKDDYTVLSYTHDHANYTDYFFPMPFTHLTLKTGAAAWKLKVLTVYNWLSKYDVSNMDEISLDANAESFLPFYAVGFSLQCPTASGGSPQTITGMLEF